MRNVHVSKENLKRFARYEITFDDLLGISDDEELSDLSVTFDDYKMTVDDVSHFIENARKKNASSFKIIDEWLDHIASEDDALYELFGDDADEDNIFIDEKVDIDLRRSLGLSNHPEPSEKDCTDYHFPIAESDYINLILDKIRYSLVGDSDEEPSQDESLPLEEAEEWISFYNKNNGKNYEDWDFPTDKKIDFIKAADRDMYYAPASERDVYLFRKFTDQLAEADNLDALIIKGYHTYEGTAAYTQSWQTSWDMLSRAFDISADPITANTLGYDCYYGRVNGGKPEYDKALKYFSFGAAFGVTESVYKLADMLANGYGIRKNEKAAFNLIAHKYESARKSFCKGDFWGSFADLALRMGKSAKDIFNDYEESFAYYLEASFAIRKRMNVRDFFGDEKVAKAIEEGLKRAREEYIEEVGDCKKNATSASLPTECLEPFFARNQLFKMRIDKLNSQTYRIQFIYAGNPYNTDESHEKLLVVLPEYEYCELVDTLTFDVRFSKKTDIPLKEWCYIDHVNAGWTDSDDIDTINFYEHKKKIGTLHCKGNVVLYLKHHNNGDKKVYRMASVRFEPNGKLYDYICDDPNIKKGDDAKVATQSGEQTVKVVRIYECRGMDLPLEMNRYKHIGSK